MDTTKYQKSLEEEAVKLKNELSQLGVQNPDVKADWVERADDLDVVNSDPNDVADRTEAYDERRATLATLEGRYNDVRRALKKIENGTYGICEISGEPIEEDRLTANPSARTCKAHMDQVV
jgi:RNA polymerase-binding transcription factor DksA